LKIAVCMKYVPSDMSRDLDEESGGIRRTEENSTINQADLFALETALHIKKKLGGSVCVLTMGPEFAVNLLREACALGADEFILISDRKIAGSDSYATALILSAALKDGYDLILCGERTVDGETGQVPGEISARLERPFLCGVTRLEKLDEGELVCACLGNGTEDIYSLPLPAVLSISNGMTGIAHPLKPSLKGLRLARQMQYKLLDLAALGISPEQVGITGAPTRVIRTTAPDWTRQSRVIQGAAQGVLASLEVLNG